MRVDQMREGAESAADKGVIRSRPRPNCALCGRAGDPLYVQQKDRLFGTPGFWDTKRCPDTDCGLIWLDPMPLTEDLGKAYLNYYTHAPAKSKVSVLSQIRQRFEMAYVRRRYGYPPSGGILARFFGFLFFYREGGSTFVNWKPGGKLLDVGCGAGSSLELMRSLGWEVEGVEFDAAAVEAARRKGLKIRCGSLEEQAYPASSFDVIMMQHVIEHVPDPVATLAECARILRPGGELLLFTPNGASLTHHIFKECWRGLEPPRHLHIFSPPSARRALEMAGFHEITVRPQVASGAISESIRLRRGCNESAPFAGESWLLREFSRKIAFLEGFLTKLKPSWADCLAALAVKR